VRIDSNDYDNSSASAFDAVSRKLTQKHQQMTLRLEIVRLLAGHG
jgi:hypothetical protein